MVRLEGNSISLNLSDLFCNQGIYLTLVLSTNESDTLSSIFGCFFGIMEGNVDDSWGSPSYSGSLIVICSFNGVEFSFSF